MLQAGVTLSATEALQGDQQVFTREQVAYLIELAWMSGLSHGRLYDQAELIATWDAATSPRETREQRVAREIAAAGPEKFAGGLPTPPTYFAGGGKTLGRIPTLEEQTWLTDDDRVYLRWLAGQLT